MGKNQITQVFESALKFNVVNSKNYILLCGNIFIKKQ